MVADKIFRRLPDFRGKRRLTRFLYHQYLKSASDVVVTGSDNCRYLMPNLIETIGFEIFVNGVYEKLTHDLLISMLPANGVFLDLGANIGSISIPVCKKRPDVKAIGVEASPRVFGYLRNNIRLNNLTNIEVLNRAILDTDGREVDFFTPAEKYGKGSLSPLFTNEGTSVVTITIDALLKQRGLARVDAIKIDIEGFEYYAFKGGARLLGSTEAPDILFEFVDWAEEQASDIKVGYAQQLLRDYGYTIYSVGKSGKLVLQRDCLTTGNYLLYATKRPLK